MNIKNKKSDLEAPTPQNTPAASSAPIAGARAPNVPKIEEEGTESKFAAALSGNPALVSMIQGKLGNLIGKSSGYVESLPESVQRRVHGLKGVQAETAKLEEQFQAEVMELEKKYLEKYKPLYERRAQIVGGKIEPTEDEVNVGLEASHDEDEEEEDSVPKPTPAAGSSDVKGIPEFWLTAMKNVTGLSEMINARDEECLRFLSDITMSYFEAPGFKLTFTFDDNEFFSNKTLTKTYYYQEENSYSGDFVYDHATGDSINWKEGKDLTVRIETKKQRNKNTKQTRVVKKQVPVDSFFNFFKPPTISEDVEEDAASDIDEKLELDYQIGEDIKEKLIPRAVDWFTGEALEFEEFDEELEGDDFEEFEDEEGDEDSDGSEDENGGSKPKQDPQECRNQ